ncbi:uncharacterized protein EI97DRAFT_431966 [Westerdykella ornata]|uniref:Uncharacterized protein n=1 Tax=Westerdykella ornata TaxID=318751 RepID=A0A6A6JMQ7_WESOR|nr:uncharacterized protein EI97DRAFT_431966 [Westerdykella ornata]KAF2277881.1 hypothetical protein EI97DRAFT_431966 [Westerdykella ornata]
MRHHGNPHPPVVCSHSHSPPHPISIFITRVMYKNHAHAVKASLDFGPRRPSPPPHLPITPAFGTATHPPHPPDPVPGHIKYSRC